MQVNDELIKQENSSTRFLGLWQSD